MAGSSVPTRMRCWSPDSGWTAAPRDFPSARLDPAVRAAAALEPLRPHDLRHPFVSLLVTAGANVKQVSTWVGHSSVTVTPDAYTHLFRDGADVDDRLDDLLPSGRSRTASVSRIGAG